jgi:hypothetical protein
MDQILPVLIGLVLNVASIFITQYMARRRLKKELTALKAENERLRKFRQDFTGSPLVLRDGVYFDESGNPYCAACFGSPHDRVPLRILNRQAAWTLYRCPRCKEMYEQGEFVPPPKKPRDPLA